jgi:hypothetical protein
VIRWILKLFLRPQMPESLPVPCEAVSEEKKPGLEVRFKEGESIPWKGIWFRIHKVGFDELTLVPESMTFKRAKQLQEARYARG